MRISVCTVFLVLVANSVHAQGGTDVQAAARAYEEGQLAQLQNDYARAARFFEIAHRAAPAAAAIRSAIRNHRAAGALPRAATLSVIAAAEYADDTETNELTTSVLAEATDTLGRLEVTCEEPCSLSVDGHLVTLSDGQEFSVFVLPGTHELVARFSTGEQSSTFDVAAGATTTRALEAPIAEVIPSDPVDVPDPIEPPVETNDSVAPPPSGLSPVVTYIGAGVTVALAGVFVWSLLDTSSASDDYHASPTQAGLDDGRGRVLRTGILGAAAGAAGVATVIIAIAATNWDGNDDDRASTPAVLPSAWAQADGGGLVLSGRMGRVQ